MKKIFPLALLLSSNLVLATEPSTTELQNQINLLADQIELQSNKASDTKVGGYGELHYNNYDNASNALDFHRFVLFVDHEFSDKIRFSSELELEHSISGEGQVGAIELEQAVIEFETSNTSNIKAGVFLIPVGIINETHEPTAFYGVERNPVEKNIIPTTWWEGGVMYSSNLDNGFSYDVAIHSGLNTSTSVRSGRQKVGNATANNLAYTGRVKYTGVQGLEVGLTTNQQTDMDQASGGVGSGTLTEAHAIYTMGKLKLTALTASWSIDGLQNTQGNILEASYKIKPSIGVFGRQNTWDDTGTGDKTQFNIGVNYWPHEDVVVKFDVQKQNTQAGNKDGFNIGLGYQF